MKPTLSTQLGQQLHLTPQLLQSIRLLQLDGQQLEMEIRRALENNPLLELEEADADVELPADAAPEREVAAFDELPESSMWDVAGSSWNDGSDDRMQHVAAGQSSDPHLRVLQGLALELDERRLAIAAFWLEHCDDAGYLVAPREELALLASARLDADAGTVEAQVGVPRRRCHRGCVVPTGGAGCRRHGDRPVTAVACATSTRTS